MGRLCLRGLEVSWELDVKLLLKTTKESKKFRKMENNNGVHFYSEKK